MRIRSLIGLILASVLALTVGACQGPPSTQYVIVITELATEIVVVTATPGAPTEATAAPTQAVAAASTPAAATAAPSMEGEPTELPENFPTPTVSQILVAEQSFQTGRLFWLEPIDQIWVLAYGEDGTSGQWSVYDDEFEEGDIEFDPSMTPPEGLLQPERGFGALWRNNDEVRGALGWALEPEVGFVSSYEYQPVGEVVDGEFIADPGFHILSGAFGDRYRFNEINGTWQLLQRSNVNPGS